MNSSAKTKNNMASLRELPNGTFARIAQMPEKDGCAERLEALGLRVGKVIEKISGMPFHGPVTLQLDGRQIAIGWKISSTMLVTPVEDPDKNND